MYDYLLFLRNQFIVIFDTMNNLRFNIGVYGSVGFLDLVLGFIALYIITAVFWRGQRV